MNAHHEESHALINASPAQVFAALDDHARLSSHMSKATGEWAAGRWRPLWMRVKDVASAHRNCS